MTKATRRGAHNTLRFKNRTLISHDPKRSRFQVYRRSRDVERRTSVRYLAGEDVSPKKAEQDQKRAFREAKEIAARLKEWPAEQLRSFVF